MALYGCSTSAVPKAAVARLQSAMADALLGKVYRRRSPALALAFAGFGLGPVHGMIMYERVAVMRRN
eukprot:5113929-Alexandrium_andersonii.AAC.1